MFTSTQQTTHSTPSSLRSPLHLQTAPWIKSLKITPVSPLRPRAGWRMGKKGLVYLERHRADFTRDSCFSVRTRSLETTRSATRLLLPHRVWVLAAPVRGHNNSRRVSWAQPLQSLPHGGRWKGGRWGALLCASSDTQSKRVASVRKAPAPTMCSTQINLFRVSLGQLLWLLSTNVF